MRKIDGDGKTEKELKSGFRSLKVENNVQDTKSYDEMYKSKDPKQRRAEEDGEDPSEGFPNPKMVVNNLV